MRTLTPNISQLRMLASVRGQLWAMRPESVTELALAALEASEKVPSGKMDDETKEWLSMFYNLRTPMEVRRSDGLAKIEVRGGLVKNAPAIHEALGIVTRYETIIAETKAAKEQGAKEIVYLMDSPGGTVAGLAEAGRAIREVGIPTVAFASGLACSACYYLASSADEIIATESAIVGNIGAILAWADCSAFWAEMGVEWKALVNEGADLKSTFHLEPNATQLEFLQQSINDAGAQFRNWVISSRGNKLDNEVFRAGWYSGDKAKSLGLIDDISTVEKIVLKP